MFDLLLIVFLLGIGAGTCIGCYFGVKLIDETKDMRPFLIIGVALALADIYIVGSAHP